MEILLINTSHILNEELSLVQWGILITIILCKDMDSKMTLARFKTKVKITKIKEDLIFLHENGYIKWSGYKNAQKSIEGGTMSLDVKDVICFMNDLYGRGFNPKSSSSTANLIPRLRENGIDDVKLVVANRYAEWKDDSVMKMHLNPGTIFKKSKFDKYLEEAKRSRVGESFVAAEAINLNHGDEITKEVSTTFIKSDTYNIKIYQTDGEGNRRGNGVSATRYGRDIQKMVILQDRLGTREHRYYYANK